MVKVHVVSGFLGAGKTTLIKKLLKTFKNEKVVILENEYGEEGIDGDVIKGDGFDVVELEQGCICCSLKTNFMDVLLNIMDNMNPSHIIIEPTGLGLLSEIINIINSKKLAEKCTLNSLITIIDSSNYLDQIEVFGDFFQDQIRCASTLILSKTQLVEEMELEKILCSLREINDKAYIINKTWDDLFDEELRSMCNEDLMMNLEKSFMNEYKKYIMNGFESLSLKLDNIYNKKDLEKIIKKLSSGNFGQVLRGKGIINTDEGTMLMDYVNGSFILSKTNINTAPKICIIGKDINKTRIKVLFKKPSISIPWGYVNK